MAEVIKPQLKRIESDAANAFMSLVSTAGLCVFIYSVYVVSSSEPPLEWILLSLVTTLVVGPTRIRIPKMESTVTLDDTFIFLSMLLYGVWPSVVLAGVNAIWCSIRSPRAWNRPMSC